MNPRRIALAIWILILFLVATGMASCSTTHKMKTTDQHFIDSAGTKKVEQIRTAKKDSTGLLQKDSTRLLQKDSTRLLQKDSTYTETITIIFDTAAAAAGEPANDYEAAPVLKPLKHDRYIYMIAGNQVHSSVPVRSATIERNGHKREIDLSHVISTDSAVKKDLQASAVISGDSTAAHNTQTTHLVKRDKKTVTEKISRHAPFIFTLLLIIALLAVALYALRRYKVI